MARHLEPDDRGYVTQLLLGVADDRVLEVARLALPTACSARLVKEA